MEMEKDFLDKIGSIYGEENKQRIIKAFHFASEKHKGQKRDTGEEYIIHPYNVAKILVDMRADVESVISGLLHDCIEDTDCTKEEIFANFGPDVGAICDGASKIEPIKHSRRQHLEENENLRKMFLTMGKDARVAFVKLADRLHNMQTLEIKSIPNRLKIAKETLDIYVTMAERLGMNSLKHTLEDLCFKYILPPEYEDITNFLNEYYKRSQSIILEIREQITELAKENGVELKLQSRLKSTFGVYKKTLTKNRNSIYDIVAHRIIVKDIKDCYTMLGAVHNKWKPVDGRIKDYIANPKPNLYMSLHTTVLFPTENGTIPFEIQIRTEEMHIFCEYGMAAHWIYKEQGSKANKTSGNSALFKMKQEMAKTDKTLADDEVDEFLQVIKAGFYADKIFVFTPNLNVVELPEGAITLDFAYAVHSNVGNHCSGARVNGKMVPITTRLETGDTVEILTSVSKTPSRNWLKICKSHSALAKIRSYFKREQRDENIKIGKTILEEYAKRRGYSLSKLLEDKETLAETFTKTQLSSVEDIFAVVGYGGLSSVSVLSNFIKKQKQIEKTKRISMSSSGEAGKDSQGILIDGHNDLLKNLAKCCSPIPGDDIIGYVSTGRGIIIHKCDCENLEKVDEARFIKADWNIPDNDDSTFLSTVSVYAKNKPTIYTDISNAIGEMGIKLVSLNSNMSKDDEIVLSIGVMVKNREQYNSVKNKLNSLAGVFEVV